MLAVLLCVMAFSAEASQKLNIYIEKDAILAHDISAADIRIRPEGMVRVTRHSLWPWDNEGTKWSMFVEIENTSDGKIVIDEDWLIACKENRDEIASADYIFQFATDILEPGERVVLHAGAYPYVKTKGNNADVSYDTWDVEGMADFAGRIEQAKVLRIRLEMREGESTKVWPTLEIEPKIWIDGRILHFEWTNETDDLVQFRTIGAVVSDGEGRVIDVIRSTYSRGAVVSPNETLVFEKELPTYITQEMIAEAEYEVFAYRMKGN